MMLACPAASGLGVDVAPDLLSYRYAAWSGPYQRPSDAYRDAVTTLRIIDDWGQQSCRARQTSTSDPERNRDYGQGGGGD